MSKLLIFIGENVKFDKAETIKALKSLDGIVESRAGQFIGAIFECEIQRSNYRTIVRLTADLETITIEGTSDDSLSLALEINEALEVSTSVVDMDYSFHIEMASVSNLDDFKKAISGGV
jgi:hypothetical protein